MTLRAAPGLRGYVAWRLHYDIIGPEGLLQPSSGIIESDRYQLEVSGLVRPAPGDYFEVPPAIEAAPGFFAPRVDANLLRRWVYGK